MEKLRSGVGKSCRGGERYVENHDPYGVAALAAKRAGHKIRPVPEFLDGAFDLFLGSWGYVTSKRRVVQYIWRSWRVTNHSLWPRRELWPWNVSTRLAPIGSSETDVSVPQN